MATAFEDNYANDELWRECALWLTRWDMLRPDHKALWPGSGIADFANILRDGVLLCKLLNKIDPGCIDMKKVNLKPIMAQFLCLRNIDLFLEACVESFGLKESDLFQASMLFDFTNFHKVLCTLSKLSLSPKGLAGNIPGFTAKGVKTTEEVIYQSLKSVDIPSRTRDIVEPIYDIASEEIYQDLCDVRTTVEQQATFEKRDFVIKELLDTEKNYVDVLNKLKKHFMEPLASQMTPEDHSTVFHKIKELHEIHLTFYQELLRVRSDPTTKLSNIFMRWREKLLIYGMYCANLTKATTILQELCENDEIFNQSVIKYEKQDNNGRFKLRDVLSVPMQRILKYHLLLEKLIENTDPNHVEYNDLRRAREAMLDVAGYINEAARDSEHLAVINKLQETILEWHHDPDLKLSDYGRLIKDAALKIKPHDNTARPKYRYLFIFDKCILICKQLQDKTNKNKFAFRDILNITDYHVDETHNRAILKEAKWLYQFHLVKNDKKTAYTFFVKSQELKQQIIKAIKDALENIHPNTLQRTSHNFDLLTFTSPVQCLHCSKYLKGLIYQGYKCNTCNIAAHKNCIQYTGKCGVNPPAAHSNHNNGVNGNGLDGDDPLKGELWFVGELDRTMATQKLQNREDGTFLVRIRPQSEENDKYALELKTNNAVKHMKIRCTDDLCHDKVQKYYLSQAKYFSSIKELILNYQNYSLKENFGTLDERLLWPYKQLRAIVMKSFEAQDSYQLDLVEGETIRVIGKEGYREGWWKGRNKNKKTGYFSSSLVRIDGEVRFES